MDALILQPRPAPTRVYLRRRIGLAVVLINLLVAGLVFALLRESRQQHDARATVAVQNLAQLLEHDLTALLDQTDLTLLALADEITEQANFRLKARQSSRVMAADTALPPLPALLDDAEIATLLARHARRQPHLNDLRIADQNGLIHYSKSGREKQPVSIADRQYFKLNQQGRPERAIVSGPLLSRINGDWMITLSRRLETGSGQFLGIVYAAIPTRYFQDIFARLSLGQAGAVAFRWEDLSLITRYPAFRMEGNATGNRFVSRQLHDALQRQPLTGTYTAPTGLDQIERRNAYRRFERYPFYVLVGLATGDYMADWYDEAYRLCGLLLLFAGVSLLLLRMIWQHWEKDEAGIQKLVRMEHKFRTLLNFAPEAIVIASQSGQILMCNRKTSDLFGYAPAQLVGQSLLQLLPPDFMCSGENPAAATGGPADFALRLENALAQAGFDMWAVDQQGIHFPAIVRLSPIETEQGPMLMLSISDITGRRQLEDTLRARQDQLEQALAATQQANQAKSVFLANISHELRTPMHGILSFSQLGCKRAPDMSPDKLVHYFSTIQHSARRLLTFLNDLIDLATLQSGQVALKRQPLDLLRLLRQVQQGFAEAMAEKQLRFDLQYPNAGEADPPPTVMADPEQLALVLNHLLANAIRFSPAGGTLWLQISVSSPLLAAASPQLCLRLRDEGIGIPEGELESIFDPFVQSSKTRTGAGGTGLGLSISRQIVTLHGGSLRAENAAATAADGQPGHGALLILCLPLSILPPPAELSEPACHA